MQKFLVGEREELLLVGVSGVGGKNLGLQCEIGCSFISSSNLKKK